MKKFLFVLLFISLPALAASQSEKFSFRDDYKPAYTETLSVAQLSKPDSDADFLVLDVRLTEDFAKNPVLIPGAQYRDPEKLPNCISQLDQSKEIVVYCVAGRWVSQKVAFLLNEAGLKVRSLEGGIDAWNSQLKSDE